MADRFWVGGTGNWSDQSSHTVVDSYSVDNLSQNHVIGTGGNATRVGQTFTPNQNCTLYSCKFYVGKTGNPTGNIVAKLYNMTGTYGSTGVPTGVALATSDVIDITTISGGLLEFIFSGANQYSLISETYYCIDIEYTGGSLPNDYVYYGWDTTSPTHSGNSFSYISSWNADANDDVIFYVYSIDIIQGHWSTSSGGDGLAEIPTSSDDVFIDENSGFGSGGTITMDEVASRDLHNFTCNSGHTFTIAGSDINVYGSVFLEEGITWTASGIFFYSDTDETIRSAGVILTNISISECPETCYISLFDDLILTGRFYQDNGTFDANNHNVTANDFYFYADIGYTPTIYMGSGTWEATGNDNNGGAWQVNQYSDQSVTISPETSTIKFTDATENTKTFYFYDDTGNETGKAYNNLWLTGSGTGEFIIYGSNTFNEFKCDTPPHTIKFLGNTIQVVSTWTVSGTAGNLITLNNDSGNTQFTLSKSSGIISSDYLNISNSNATGGATWYAGSHSVDTTINSGWIFEDAPTTGGVKDIIGSGIIPFAR